MTALERLPDRMDRLARVIATLSARIEDSRRETRVLHEDVIARFALLGEVLRQTVKRLPDSGEMRVMFDTVNSRLTAMRIGCLSPAAGKIESTDRLIPVAKKLLKAVPEWIVR